MYQEDNKISYLKIILRALLFIIIFILTFKLISMAFNQRKQYLENNNMSRNLKSMQTAAIDYFKNDNINIEIGETKKITLKELIDNNKIGELKDEYEFVCSSDDSYVELNRTETEYRVKTYLSCNNKSDYSYTYLDSETKEEERDIEPTTTSIEVETTTTTTSTTSTNKTTTNKTTKTNKTTTTTQKKETTTTTTAPIVITTKPAIERWSISYNCNGGTINGYLVYSVKVEKGKEFVLPIPQKEGFRFLHWEDSNGNIYTGTIKPTSDLILIAKWH